MEQTASPTFVVPITAIFAKQPWMPRRIVRQIFSMFLPGFDGRLSHQMYPNVATSMSEKDQNYPLPEDHPGIKYHKLMVSEVLTYPHVFILIYDAHVGNKTPKLQSPWSPQALNACHNAHSLSSVHRFRWHELFVKRVANQSNKKLLVKQDKSCGCYIWCHCFLQRTNTANAEQQVSVNLLERTTRSKKMTECLDKKLFLWPPWQQTICCITDVLF